MLLVSLLIGIFIAGIFYLVFLYRKRKMLGEKEKQLLEERHHLALATAQTEIQQQTMQEIGRDIHDNIGQKLVLAALYTQQLQHEQQQHSDKLQRIGNTLNESLAELRQLSKALTDRTLENTPLEALLQREAEKVNLLGHCLFTLQWDEKIPATGFQTKVFALRIVQEFIQNSLKHADCKNILADVRMTADGLAIHLADDGAGFNTGELSAPGIGLENMKKRAALLGAGFSLTSIPGKGTDLLLSLPATQITR